MTRGIRNNNPGNIDYRPANNWKGQLPYDKSIEPRFCRFSAPEYGIRAIIALLRNYQGKYALKTIRGLISRWAPSNENNTNAYVSGVSKALGVDPDASVSLVYKDTAISLAKAIIYHENGCQPYSDAVFEKAYALL
ncbi:TPA: structural protein [Morganella morganii]|uniref:Structural protein n=1 Tax=Morganella morganii TaxID=582 RepID=A0A8I0Q345_MORMO|nr:structural protein [Morganella morganii]MBE8613940.1 structural protein [Morganella morganii]HEI8461977.1 structural protein [Morganella morganii]